MDATDTDGSALQRTLWNIAAKGGGEVRVYGYSREIRDTIVIPSDVLIVWEDRNQPRGFV